MQCIYYRRLPRIVSGILRNLFLYLCLLSKSSLSRKHVFLDGYGPRKIQANFMIYMARGTQRQFSEYICLEDDSLEI